MGEGGHPRHAGMVSGGGRALEYDMIHDTIARYGCSLGLAGGEDE